MAGPIRSLLAFWLSRSTLHLMNRRTPKSPHPIQLNLPPGSGTFDRSDRSHGNLFSANRTSVGVRLEAPLLRGTPGNVNHSISSRTPSSKQFTDASPIARKVLVLSKENSSMRCLC